MFREMRRKGQELYKDENIAILNRGTSGVLAVYGDEGYPYAVPLSYVYDGEKIYFHCAKTGHKVDAIRKNSKVSFCVVDMDDVIPEEFRTSYRSVIVFAQARIIENEKEKYDAIKKLSVKYSPCQPNMEQEIEKYWDNLCMIELEIEHMTGKAAKNGI